MRNQFNLSHEHKTACDMGELIPVMCKEVLPGDTFLHSASALTRVSPLQHPLMHRVELRLHTFYVPNRILWSGWEDFITGKNTTDPKPMYTTLQNERLLDYMGIPPIAGLEVDQAPLQAYNLIYNDFYRDQDLQAERDLLDTSVARCAWQKDYFTIARPQPQQGDPVDIPIQGLGGIYGTNSATPTNIDLELRKAPADDRYFSVSSPGGEVDEFEVRFQDGSISIDDFRRSMALQRFAEARMRFGSRYIDYLRYIGVNPSDGRLDRPEYLGGGKENLAFSEVLTTAQVPDHNVGEMFGHGIALGRANGYRKMFEEHGWVMTLLSARPKTVYQNALPRQFTRLTAMDYWQKELEVLPWQEVPESEIFAGGDASSVWGYVPRYEEYRHGVSHVSGSLRGGTENDWHMAREFNNTPALNGSFVECTPTERIYQDADQPDLIVNVMHNLQARRFVGSTATMGQDI
ncbi:major capsid protein [Microviridae sp.]|nr:major capsid protein [Microviridae sp.]